MYMLSSDYSTRACEWSELLCHSVFKLISVISTHRSIPTLQPLLRDLLIFFKVQLTAHLTFQPAMVTLQSFKGNQTTVISILLLTKHEPNKLLLH